MPGNKALKIEKPVQQSVRELLGVILEKGRAEAVFTLRKTAEPGRFCYSLISDPEILKQAVPFHPVMPVQGAAALSELTVTSPLDRKVLALLRPCELRAFTENVKQSQGSLDNLTVMSFSCEGVIPAGELLEHGGEEPAEDLRANRREACSRCREFLPGPLADMTVVMEADRNRENTLIYLNSPDAEEMVEGLNIEEVTSPTPLEERVTGELKERTAAFNRFLKSVPPVTEGLSSLVSMFSSCISCRACREACPICTCVLCDYETRRTIHSPELIREEAQARGAFRVPSGTLQFQLGRLNHIAPMCVSCGQCSDVCPVDIPVADIFARAAAVVQKTLDYSPGKDLDDEPPMSVYEESELQDVMD